jgi:lipopolysaccharide transport system ATP-binding protein
MSSEPAIRVESLVKEYRIGQRRGRVMLADGLRDALRARSSRRAASTFRALEDVTFDVAPGTALGVIGRNGAGKSTLLKVLSRITRPTQGRAVLHGRVGSLLEVGSGFHPELTGRENLFMNGSMLGMRRAEILRKFDEIVAFAEVERFIDTPVKRYSSGMYVRLAFSVAAHLDPEILLVDEVLAVGDVAFQRRCLGKMNDVASQGRTVLFVSHNTAAIQQLTTECVLLDAGRIVAQGRTPGVLETYLALAGSDLSDVDVSDTPRVYSGPDDIVRLTRVRLVDDINGSCAADDEPTFEVTVSVREQPPAIRFSLTVYRFDGTPVGTAFGLDLPAPPPGQHSYRLTVRAPRLAPGRYYLALAVGRGNLTDGFVDYDVVTETAHFGVLPPENADGTTAAWAPVWGVVRLDTPHVVPVSIGVSA